jgi:hypothetical protein
MKKKLVITTILTSLTISLTGVCTLFNPSNATAQGTSDIDLSVSPPVKYFHIEPGQKKTIGITLEQKGRVPLEIVPSLVDFSSDGETGQPVLGDASDFRYLTVTLPNDDTETTSGTSFILKPGNKKNISLTLDIPTDAVEGEYPLTVLFRAKPDSSSTISQPGSKISAVVGSNLIVLISTTNRDRSNLLLEEIRTYKLVDSFMPLSFKLLAKNSGHNATTASGSATIKNWQNNEVAYFPMYPDMVLAQSTRLLRTASDLEAASNDVSLIKNDFEYKPLFAIGPYTITATLEKHSNDILETSTVTQTVFALPFSLVIIILIIIGVWSIFSFLSTKNKNEETLEEN